MVNDAAKLVIGLIKRQLRDLLDRVEACIDSAHRELGETMEEHPPYREAESDIASLRHGYLQPLGSFNKFANVHKHKSRLLGLQDYFKNTEAAIVKVCIYYKLLQPLLSMEQSLEEAIFVFNKWCGTHTRAQAIAEAESALCDKVPEMEDDFVRKIKSEEIIEVLDKRCDTQTMAQAMAEAEASLCDKVPEMEDDFVRKIKAEVANTVLKKDFW